MPDVCSHLDGLSASDFPEPQPKDACAECLEQGTTWVALRECRECGHVGCCDSSEGKHATAHYKATDHPVMRSVMPGDTWTWCYVDSATGSLSN